jgi:fructose-1,6-bisphosphatase
MIDATAIPARNDIAMAEPIHLSADRIMKQALQSTGMVRALASAADAQPMLVRDKEDERSGYGTLEAPADSGGRDRHQSYVVVFDALHASHEDCADDAASTGSTFAIYKAKSTGLLKRNATESRATEAIGERGLRGEGTGAGGETANEAAFQALRPGREIVVGGYCVFSSSTILVLATSGGCDQGSFSEDGNVNVFSLDSDQCGGVSTSSSSGRTRADANDDCNSNDDPVAAASFLLTHRSLVVPRRGNTYCLDEATAPAWDDRLREYVSVIQSGRGQSGARYSGRFIGAISADFHRTLLCGGIFGLPELDYSRATNSATATSTKQVRNRGDTPRVSASGGGTICLACCAAPLAFVAKHAGADAWSTCGGLSTGEILDVEPATLLERAPVFFGSASDVLELRSFFYPDNPQG